MAAQVPGCEEKWPTEQPIKVTLFAINYFGNGANSDRRAAQTYLLTYFIFSGIFTIQFYKHGCLAAIFPHIREL